MAMNTQIVRDPDDHRPSPPRQLAPSGGTPGYPSPATQPDDDIIDLGQYWLMLVRHRRMILAIVAFAALVALISTFLTTPIYRASVLLQIERESGKVVEYKSVDTPENIGDSKDFYQTQYELLRSRTLARRVIDQLGLRASETYIGAKRDSFLNDLERTASRWFSAAPQTGPNDPDAREQGPDIETLFLDNLTVGPVKNSRLVRIDFDSPDPVEAATIANALAENFVNTSLERRYQAASYAKTFLEGRIELARATLDDSERRLLTYAREREIIDLDDKLGMLMTQLKDLSKEQVSAEAERIAAEAEDQQMTKDGSSRTRRTLDNLVVQKLKDRLAELTAQYQDRIKVFKPAYPKMQQLQQQITEIERRIAEESTTVGSAARSTYEEKVRKDAKLTARINAVKGEILALQDRSTDYQTLKRDVDTNRQLYDGLLQRMKEVGVVAGIGTNNIAVVDPAEVPREKYKPSLRLNLAIGVALGLLAGIALVFLLESLDDRIKSTQDLERRLEAPILGLVPWVRESRKDRSRESLGLLVFDEPKSAIAEAFRSLRTALIFSSADGAPRVLHFVSAGAGEGKTTSACGTAIVLAQTGSKVLLIDCDLRNPSLHRSFELPNVQGLTTYLIGSADPTQVALPSQVKGLFVLPSGPLPPNPVELLSGGRMIELLERARERFDFVVLDGPPVLGLADAVILANLARATVMVVESAGTRATAVEGSARRLRAAGANILGAILVKHKQAGTYGYGYDYHYSYNYGSEGHQSLTAEAKG